MSEETQQQSTAALWSCIVCGGLAGGLAWGIRGQYGHETGAMLSGLLIGLSLTLLLCPQANSLAVARAVAWCTVAIGIGGSETYAQTVGLTQHDSVIGNWSALRWGMLGLAVKGAIWIGFGGAFLGMGLGGVRYRWWEMLMMMLGLIGLSFLGYWLINQPYRPADKILPRIYFSADWHWQPDAGPELKPRREFWGGQLCALAGLIAYIGLIRRDALGWRMPFWGILGGAIGFPGGQCLQAFHAWNKAGLFQQEDLAKIDPLINWWNFMETSFGAIMGATLGLGLWLNRRRINLPSTQPPASFPGWLECALIAVHIFLLLCAEFDVLSPFRSDVTRVISSLYGPGLQLALIPIVCITAGRKWPYWLLFPITIIPIAGKTLRELAYVNHLIPLDPGWQLYVFVPVGLMLAAAIVFARCRNQDRPARDFLCPGLLLATWIPYGLNFAFFHHPWPWQEWTYRTPNNIVFTICAVGLTILSLLTVPKGNISP